MTSQAGHHGGGSQLYPNQGIVNVKAARDNILGRLRALLQILSTIFFRWELLFFLYLMAFMLIPAHGEEHTGICKMMNPAIIWNVSSVVNSEMIGLCLCSSTEQLLMQRMNMCIPQVHIHPENPSPDPLGPLSPSRANVKGVMMVFAIIGGIGLAGRMLYTFRPAFTEADINMGLMGEPAVPRQRDPTFEIHPSIE